MLHKPLLFTFLLLVLIRPAFAYEAALSNVPKAAVVGQGVLSYAVWDVYKATLYAADGRWDKGKPFALSIEYFHDLRGKDIAIRSVKEMRGQGFKDDTKLTAWKKQMKTIFPDVKEGTVLTAVYTPRQETVFYQGNQRIGAIKGDEFGQLFFGIWLSERTSNPALRRALLGLS